MSGIFSFKYETKPIEVEEEILETEISSTLVNGFNDKLRHYTGSKILESDVGEGMQGSGSIFKMEVDKIKESTETYSVKHDGVEPDHPTLGKLFGGRKNVINHLTKYKNSAEARKKHLEGLGFKNVRIETKSAPVVKEEVELDESFRKITEPKHVNSGTSSHAIIVHGMKYDASHIKEMQKPGDGEEHTFDHEIGKVTAKRDNGMISLSDEMGGKLGKFNRDHLFKDPSIKEESELDEAKKSFKDEVNDLAFEIDDGPPESARLGKNDAKYRAKFTGAKVVKGKGYGKQFSTDEEGNEVETPAAKTVKTFTFPELKGAFAGLNKAPTLRGVKTKVKGKDTLDAEGDAGSDYKPDNQHKDASAAHHAPHNQQPAQVATPHDLAVKIHSQLHGATRNTLAIEFIQRAIDRGMAPGSILMLAKTAAGRARLRMDEEVELEESAKWRQQTNRPTGPGLGKTFVKTVTDYGDRVMKEPIGRAGLDDNSEPISGNDILGDRQKAKLDLSTRGLKLLKKNAQRNLKGNIKSSLGKHVTPSLPESVDDLEEAVKDLGPVHKTLTDLGYKVSEKESSGGFHKRWYVHSSGKHPVNATELASRLGHKALENWSSIDGNKPPVETRDPKTGAETEHQGGGTLYVGIHKDNKDGGIARKRRAAGYDV